jgi:hypothetical protein
METKHIGEEKRAKEPYTKPRLRVINIEADQVLGVGCKLDSGGSAFGASPCPANFCAEAGS